jgi:hypothetical protein
MSCKVTVSILIFSLSVSAGPVLSSSNDSNVCLAVSLVILSVLAILVTLKCLFIKQRRAQSIHSKSSTTRPSTPTRSSVTLGSHLSVSCDHSLHDNRGKPGVLIGLFGSPIWETRRVKESGSDVISRSSLMYQLHTKSRHPRDSHSACTQSTIYLPQASGHLTVNDSLERRGSGSSQSPTLPTRIRTKSETTGTSLRFVRPTSSIKPASPRRRSNSVGPKTTQSHEDSGITHIPSYASLRLVKDSISPGPEIYTSPPTTVTGPLVLPSVVTSILESLHLPSKPPKAQPQVRTLRPKPVSLHYDITGTTALFSSDLTCCDTQNFSNSARSPLSPVNGTINSRVSESSPSRSKGPPVVLSSPFYPQPSAAKMFIKRAKMARSRKSPPLGPSPLRTMILPETLLLERDSSVDRLKTSETDAEVRTHSEIGSAYHLAGQSANLGASFRDSGSEFSRTNKSPFSRDVNENLGVQDSNMLLGMIRDLVEETKEWDQSLFMNENFRSLISDCGLLKPTSDLLGGSSLDFSRPKTLLAQEPNDSTDDTIELDLLWQEDSKNAKLVVFLFLCEWGKTKQLFAF